MTNYAILRKRGELWEQFSAAYAKNPKAAIRKALEGQGDDFDGEYVVVPASSWWIYEVDVVTKTEIRFL